MSSSDEDNNLRLGRNIQRLQFSPQLRPVASLGNTVCPYCNHGGQLQTFAGSRTIKATKNGNIPQFNQSQRLDSFMNQPFRIKNKTDFSEYEKKLKRAGKEIERLNRIIADQSIELEALNFVKSMGQFEVDSVLVAENTKLKKDLEEAQQQLLHNHTNANSQLNDNSEVYNLYGDKKDLDKYIPMEISAFDLEETPNLDHTPSDYSLEVGVNRLDEIRKLLKEDYKLNKHQQQEALGQISQIQATTGQVQIDDYFRKRQEIYGLLHKLKQNPAHLSMTSPAAEKITKILNVSRKQSVIYDEMTPQNANNKSTYESFKQTQQ